MQNSGNTKGEYRLLRASSLYAVHFAKLLKLDTLSPFFYYELLVLPYYCKDCVEGTFLYAGTFFIWNFFLEMMDELYI